jgi:hypothetical protein
MLNQLIFISCVFLWLIFPKTPQDLVIEGDWVVLTEVGRVVSKMVGLEALKDFCNPCARVGYARRAWKLMVAFAELIFWRLEAKDGWF